MDAKEKKKAKRRFGRLDDRLGLAMMEAVWIMRWTKNKQAMYAVMEPEEAMKICADLVVELRKAGYEIVKSKVKSRKKSVKGK